MYGNKPRVPGLGYLSMVVIVILVAWFFIRPLGLQVRDIFQTLVNAFGHR